MSEYSIKNARSHRQEIIEVLHKYIGLNINSLGDITINRAISKAIKLSQAESEIAYLQQLKISKNALQQLIECVVVPETHFFRHPETFQYLLKHIRKDYLNKENKKKLRILSLPCSSGEETYSIAITLLEAGLTHDHFQVDGVDINQQSLSIARQGIYGSYSFRSTSNFSSQNYLNKYFEPVDKHRYCIQNKIRSEINFYQHNILNFDNLYKSSLYDIIFCRNLLIYFHSSARDQAFHNLYHLLVPDGLLFVGYAETHQVDLKKFKPLAVPQAFAFQKLSDKRIDQKEPLRLPQNKIQIIGKDRKISDSQRYRHQKYNCLSISKDKKSTKENKLNNKQSPDFEMIITREEGGHKKQGKKASSDLADIRKLANHGKLEAAFIKCEAYLKANPMSAEGYLLLGEVYQAQGSDEYADIAFQRAIYLNPSCVEALNHRLLLCEQKADREMVARLRQRIIRLNQES